MAERKILEVIRLQREEEMLSFFVNFESTHIYIFIAPESSIQHGTRIIAVPILIQITPVTFFVMGKANDIVEAQIQAPHWIFDRKMKTA